MITRTELLEVIANGESSGVEFKADVIQPQDLARELVAFSNLEGGMVALGVDDGGSVSGLTRSDIEEWVMSVCREKIRPAIVPFFDVVRNFVDGKDIAIVRVPRGYGVNALWHDDSNKYLIRLGTRSREASQEELAGLLQRKGAMRTEWQPVSGTSLEHLDPRRLRNYFGDIRGQDVPAGKDEKGWLSLLVNTGIMTDEGVSVGGMLLFGRVPNRFLAHAGIDAVAYPGSEQDYDALERTVLRGPMTPLLNENKGILGNGLVEQALDFVQRNTRMTVESRGGRRMERPVYPQEALREAIVNALIHRDYLITNTNIRLSIYSDRLEIVSPGRLPNGITPAHLRAGTRRARNEFLRDFMRDYRCPKFKGRGIPRKIVKGMMEHNGTEPDLIEQDERFVVRLYAKA